MKSIRFRTDSPPTPARLPDFALPFLRATAAATCRHATIEGTMLMTLATGLELRKKLEEGESGLGALFAKTYARIAATPAFMLTSSAVPFFLSGRPKGGHYFLHVPPGADSSTPVLLLMHGYGGNFLYFPWAVWNAVPECILVAPSWQINWSDGPLEKRIDYVMAVVADAREKTGLPLMKPWLVPLSQGGPTAFHVAAAFPTRFSGLLGISTWAGSIDGGSAFGSKFPIRMLHGDEDARVDWKSTKSSLRAIKIGGANCEFTTIKGANHFLLLTHREELEAFFRRNLGLG